MANDQKFIHPSEFPIQYEFRPNSITRVKPNDSDFVASIRNELIAGISAIGCSACQLSLIDLCTDDTPPLTGYCGHLFCSGCAESEFENFIKSVTDPFSLNPVCKFYVKFDIGGGKNKVLYECHKCADKTGKSGGEVEEHLRVFSVNIMLKKLYIALKQPGYFCRDRRCSANHPRHNSLYCGQCHSFNRQDKYRSTCVWHASGHEGHDSQQIMNNSPYIYHRESESEPKLPLVSLDRSKRQVFAPLYHCAYCTKYLKDLDEVANPDRFPFHLQCGHFIHDACMKAVCEHNLESKIFCIFCNEVLGIIGAKHCFVTSRDLHDIMGTSPCRPMKCNTCKSLNPVERNASGPCEWCQVERQVQNKARSATREAEIQNTLKSSGINFDG